MKGILGRKVGMTQVFSEHGRSIPVTVIEVQPNVVTNVLTKEKHGYTAVQLAAFDRREKTSTKPLIGHFKKASTGPKYYVREIRGMEGFEIGQEVKGTIFGPGQLVDVEGISKGHGFQGTIKRYNQHIGPKSHGGGGGSQPVRQTGSLGDMVSNRVFKGMTMPGHMGVDKVTVQNLEVVAFNEKINALLVKGSIPGPKKGFVIVTEAIKGLASREATNIIDNGKELEIKTPVGAKAKKVVKIETKQDLEQPVKTETVTPKEVVKEQSVEEVSLPESPVAAPQSAPEEEIDEALEMEMLEHGEEE